MAEIKQLNEIELNNNLTSIANNIRNKLNIYNKLEFPDDFLENLENTYSLEDLVQHKIKEGPFYLKEATQIGMASFSNTNITEIHAPRVISFYSNTDSTGVSPFQRCTKLTLIDMPNLSGCGSGGYQFSNCTGLTSVFLPKFTTGTHCFANCTNLVTAVIQGTGQMNGQCFYNDTKLTTVDLAHSRIHTQEFNGCSKLTTVILRRTAGVPTLTNINAFAGTPFASGKAGGTLYVPAALIDSYKTASNWKTILGYLQSDGETPQNQILPIEGSIYENYYGNGQGFSKNIRIWSAFPYTNKIYTVQYNNSYTNTFNFSPYSSDNFTIKVIMGGTDVTNEVCSINNNTITINIEHVTGYIYIFIEKILPTPENAIPLFENITTVDTTTGGTIISPEGGWKQFTSSAAKSWNLKTVFKGDTSLFPQMNTIYGHIIRMDIDAEWINFVSGAELYIDFGSFKDIDTSPIRTAYYTNGIAFNKNLHSSILFYIPDNKYEWHSVIGDSSTFPEDTDYLGMVMYFYSDSGGSIKINSINFYDLGPAE